MNDDNSLLRRWVHARLLPDTATVAEAHDDLTAAWRVADELQQLSPLQLLPTEEACACRGRPVCVDPDTYVSSDDDGDWLTCPDCHQPTVMITPGAGITGLLAAHADHTRRASAADATR
ncbi:hypothetical protein [Krasilnikovia sp. M28-CT-15]|uniref:hypothetical protein n=1 Tax=Krasilnikovia sp. M28-CT-15 TaxID=3373540 RepID=UPI003876208E